MIKRLCRMMGGTRIDKEEALTGLPLEGVLVGAIYAGMQSAYINSYRTGINVSELRLMLDTAWGISDTESAVEALERLLTNVDDPLMELIFRAYAKPEEAEALFDREFAGLEREQFNELINIYRTLERVGEECLEEGLAKSREEIARVRNIGWQVGRCSYVARCACDVGYIDEAQRNDFVERSRRVFHERLGSWRLLAVSYCMGRGLWNGESQAGAISIAQGLLEGEHGLMKDD